MKYQYTLTSYNEKGHSKKLKFKTSRELKENAYILLDVRISGVHSWEEVEYRELPSEVKKMYE